MGKYVSKNLKLKINKIYKKNIIKRFTFTSEKL